MTSLGMRFVIVVLASLALMGCSVALTEKPTDEEVAAATKAISYFRDEKTGICFASIRSTTYGGYVVVSLASVPCESIAQ